MESGSRRHKVTKDPVFQGLKKKLKCSLCEHEFYLDELPGAISYKSVLELREKWGENVRKNSGFPKPALLYERRPLCIFCTQFFVPNESGSQEKETKHKKISVKTKTFEF
eukprot:gb/GECH01012924.1/.p1 GENE.gb/GECH01012924.1/~~gb/GECH01012924.1/.p1  ORF type:complete len:110 (+),score=8.89 gb/GECH01012924.1/:1-330(+)